VPRGRANRWTSSTRWPVKNCDFPSNDFRRTVSVTRHFCHHVATCLVLASRCHRGYIVPITIVVYHIYVNVLHRYPCVIE
jgi:hypothetical protein